ncbi:PA14 domain-containing protein [Phaeobacter italicus]|uniref:PA14 domain-containing protein n=1 Tax=Phaeobacter italicus TaxID=481446 RepID=UPI00243248AC|nr:PA14 domain-containing protein [Phaeobacter italicus]MCI5099674.1 PA14 domain-containing protein [Phaeobacter italicus]
MSFTRFLGLAAAAAISLSASATLSLAAPLQLKPADPQPKGLKPGLSVRYAYPSDVKTLSGAKAALKRGKAGPPLAGLDYADTDIGQKTLTSERAENVAADIKGYVRFEAAGVYTIDFLVNDGLRARVGGQVVGEFDGRQPCDSTFSVDVSVPTAGWYPVDILYFQRTKTSCLHMRMAPKGSRPTWMANSAFGR